MQAVRSILVVLDPAHAHSRALTRAKLIAGVTGARLHLLMCDKRHDHSALLSLLSRQLHDDGYDNVTHEEAGTTACTTPSSMYSRPKAANW